MPFGRPGDDGWLMKLLMVKDLSDSHIDALASFQTCNVVNTHPYHHLVPRRQVQQVVGGQEDWQDVNDHVEERLDRLRGGGRVEHETAWWLFTSESAYSPLRLRDELGWEPKPRGLPTHCDPALFGWVDAFEDLLAVSSAAPMMSFERRETMNEIMMRLWGKDKVPGHYFLFNRMLWQGLNEVYFPMYWPAQRYRSPWSMEEWAAVRQKAPIPSNNWEKAFDALALDIHVAGGFKLLRFLMGSDLPEGEATLNGFYEAIKALDDMIERGRSEAEEDGASDDPGVPSPPTSEPAETEEDLYLTTLSNSDDKPPGGPLTSLFRLMGRTVWGDDMDKDARKTEHKTADGGSETVFEKSEATPDDQGRISIIAIDKKDKHGRITSSEFHASINQPPFSSPFWKKFWENARPHDGSGGSRGEDSK